MKNKKNLILSCIGVKKFGKLIITEFLGSKRHGKSYHRVVRCVCECGNVKDILFSSLERGLTKSCGCINKKRLTKHGLANHPLYDIWDSMKTRCYKTTHKNYKWYGGRGIYMCDEWKNNFISFYNWAIENNWQAGLEVDRENNDGGYTPSNCRIVTHKINSRNKQHQKNIEYKGQIKTVSEWAEFFGIKRATLHNRLFRAKLSFEDAISKKKKYYGVKEENKNKRNALGQYCKDAIQVCK